MKSFRRVSSLRHALTAWICCGIFFFTFSAIWFYNNNLHTEKQTNLSESQRKGSKGSNAMSKVSQSKVSEIKQEETISTLQQQIQEELPDKKDVLETDQVSLSTVAFYYPWYGNPEVNGEWYHWNHKVLDNSGKFFQPPDDIGANFYPLLGPYSSTDPEVVDNHMQQLKSARVGILCVSWWGKSNSDSQLKSKEGFTDSALMLLLDTAEKYNMKLCLHHEPYEGYSMVLDKALTHSKGRSPLSVKSDLEYVMEKYGKHPALFRWKQYGNRPLFFFYDAYLVSADQWATILQPSTRDSIRGTEIDAVMIALYVDHKDEKLIVDGGFDGAYTYFASNGFTFGSSTRNWPYLSQWCKSKGKIFIPSVGPGYDDTRIRPWNAVNKKDRRQGKYYDEMWQAAVAEKPAMISVTSFNEWHEGTQIEPSIPKTVTGYTYSDFTPLEPDYYLQQTRLWVDRFMKNHNS